MLCVVYCLSVSMLGVCMYGGWAAYPGSDKEMKEMGYYVSN